MPTITGKIIKLNRSKTAGIIETKKDTGKERIKFEIADNNIRPLFLYNYYRLCGTFTEKTFIVSDVNNAVEEIGEEDIAELFPTLSIEDIDRLRTHFNILRLGDFINLPEEDLTDAALQILGNKKAQIFISVIENIKRKQDYLDVWKLIKESNTTIDISTVIKIVNTLRYRATLNGVSVFSLIRQNPWIITQTDVFESVTEAFKIANNVASLLGYSEKDSKAVISYAIALTHIYTQRGHSYIPYYSLVSRVSGLMKINREAVKGVINSALKDTRSGYLVRYNAFSEEIKEEYAKTKNVVSGDSETDSRYIGYSVYIPKIFFMERYIAKTLSKILSSKPVIDRSKYLEEFIQRNDIVLTAEQKEAVLSVPKNKVTVITGGAGTGKSTVIKVIKEVLSGTGYEPVILAPTGIASQRIAPGEGATIHRYAHIFDEGDIVFDEIQKEEFGGPREESEKDMENRRKVIIVDEMSMITVPVFAKLLSVTSDAAAFVFVGDNNQLPPIGAGGVFKTLIELGREGINNIKTICLSKVFRATNSILANVEKLIAGQEIFEDENLKIFEASSWREISTKVVEIINDLLANGVSYSDIMVLSDKRGEGKSGTSLLNQVIRERVFNIQTGDKYSEGDIIITTRNDYDTGLSFFRNRIVKKYISSIREQSRPTIFNGTVGVIKEIMEDKVIIEYNNPVNITAEYNIEELDWYIEHGFAITVHKAQGGQAKYVIFATDSPEKLSREMLYTALTRSREKVYLVGGTKKAWQAERIPDFVLTKLKYKVMQELQESDNTIKTGNWQKVSLIE